MKRITATLILSFLLVMVLVLFLAPAQIFAPPSHIYVNVSAGDDSWNGASPTYTGGDNGPKKTIGNAITFMAAYGTIEIAAGIYNENLTIHTTDGETLTLNGAGANKTIIDGGGIYRVFTIDGTGTVIMNDLTITNGGGPIMDGAGIENWNATVNINNCILIHNNDGVGGAIKNNSGNFEIYYTRIIDNYGSQGGGAIFNNAGEVIIHYSSIDGNSSDINAGGIVDVNNDTVNAQNNWWGSPTGPSGGIADYGNPSIFANGKGDEISGHIYFFPWLKSDPFKHNKEDEAEEVVWVRDHAMTCYQVWVNADNMFEMVFWWPYMDNNWVKIYDMNGMEVYSVNMPLDNPHIIVDLLNGMYTVKTFHDQPEPLQTFVIGK